MLTDLLCQFEGTLLEKKSYVLVKLQSGLEREEVETMLLDGQAYAPSLLDLYGWRNGNRLDLEKNAIEQLELFPEAIMMPIQEALEVYKLYTRDEPAWERGLFPIFCNGGGSYLLLDVSNSSTLGKVYLYDPVPIDLAYVVTIYDSIESMFQSVIDCIEKGAYLYRPDGTIELDFDLRRQVCSKLNPQSAYWEEN